MNIINYVLILCQFVLSVGVPLYILFILLKKQDRKINIILMGMLIWLLSQIVVWNPLSQMFERNEWYYHLSQNTISYGLFLGLTSALIVEGCRYLGLNFFSKDLDYNDAVRFGFGQGWIESLMLVGLISFINFIYSILIVTGLFDPIMTSISVDLALDVKRELTRTNSISTLITGFTTISSIIIHIGLSVLMLYGIKRREKMYLLYAIIIHTLISAPLYWFDHIANGEWYSLAYSVLCATIAIPILIRLKNTLKSK